MEKLPHQYRDELVNKLKEIRNSDPENPEVAKAKAQGYLQAKKETREYQLEYELKNIKLPFEWGPELGKMSWKDASQRVTELTEDLKEGEKPWRLPTREEWDKVVEPYMKQLSLRTSGKGTYDAFARAVEFVRQKNNLREGGCYWLSEPYQSCCMDDNRYHGIHTYYHGYGDDAFVKCVR